MKVLPDIPAVWGNLISINVPSYIMAAKDYMTQYCVNGMPTFVWPVRDGGLRGRFVFLQISSTGESVLIEDFKPFGLADYDFGFQIFENTVIVIYQDRIIRSQFAFDPNTGLIAAIHPAIEQAGFTQWCGGGLNKQLDMFPSFFSDRIHIYGRASAGGTSGGTSGPFRFLVYAERGDPSTSTWNALQYSFPELAPYYGNTTNGAIDGNTANATAIALTEGYIAWSHKSVSTPDYYITIKNINVQREWNAPDCEKKEMKFGSNTLLDINMYDVYGPHHIDGTLYSIFPTNYYSVSMKAEDTFSISRTDWVIYIKYHGPVIQRMTLPSTSGYSGSNPQTWGTFVFDSGIVLKIGLRFELNVPIVYVLTASAVFDTSKPKFNLPAFPIQPAPVRSSDLRTLYRSK